MKKLSKNEYKCQKCKGIFIKGRSDEEAMAEMYERAPEYVGSGKIGKKDDDLGYLCDPCYNKFMKWWDNGGKEICENDIKEN